MKLELLKVDGKTVGYCLVPENVSEQFALNDIRNHHFFGFDDASIRYDSIETSKETGKEMVTRMKFVQHLYQYDETERQRIESFPVVDKNTDTLIDVLRKECFAVVRDAINNSYDKDAMGLLMNLSLQHKDLPVAPLVIETYLGIIGYQKWLKQTQKCPISFISDALHDLSGCIAYNRNDGYVPRTYEFIPDYKL